MALYWGDHNPAPAPRRQTVIRFQRACACQGAGARGPSWTVGVIPHWIRATAGTAETTIRVGETGLVCTRCGKPWAVSR